MIFDSKRHSGRRACRGLKADMAEPSSHFRVVPIVLQKSFCTGDLKSAGRRFGFRVRMRGPHRLTLNAQATSVTRRRACESAISSRLVFLRKIPGPATFDFCNNIGTKGRSLPCTQVGRYRSEADIAGQFRRACDLSDHELAEIIAGARPAPTLTAECEAEQAPTDKKKVN